MIGLGSDKNFGRLGLKTLAYYFSTGLIAICIGLFFVNVIQPGNVDDATREAMTSQMADPELIEGKLAGRSADDIWDIFLRMIPTNIIDTASVVADEFQIGRRACRFSDNGVDSDQRRAHHERCNHAWLLHR